MALATIAWIVAAIMGAIVWWLRLSIVMSFTSPLRNLPGPPSRSWLLGYFPEIWNAENSVLQEEWVERYGPTIAYMGLLGVSFPIGTLISV